MKNLKRVVLFFIFFTFIFSIILSTTSKATAAENITGNESENQVIAISDEEQEVLNLINEYRNENGLEDLTIDKKLQETAKIKADDLVENNYFSHTSPILGTPFELMKSQGIRYKIAGENLAGNISSEKAVEAWINSKDHRENILEKKFHKTGICVVESPVYGKIYVQLFMN